MRLSLLCASFLTATVATADDAALLIGNERYITLDRMVSGATIVGTQDSLRNAGFVVQSRANANAADITRLAQTFAAESRSADRLVAGLVGRFATDGTRSWFLPVDAAPPTYFGQAGHLSLESLMRVLGQTQGQAVLVLGVDSDEDQAFDRFLNEGLGILDIPQGVTVVVATPGAAAGLMTDLAVAGADIMALVADNRRLSVDGFTPEQLVLVDEVVVVAPEGDAEGTPPTADDQAAETALWEGARALDTEDAYRNYLARYPEGQFVAEADALITEITTEPNRAERLTEEALGLNRDARRDIQRDLTLLDFNPRGIDGIFGPGTRNAVKNWQQQNGFSQTTYLTTEQINRLDAQAARRAAELEAAAERARVEQQRLDRAFWDETGARGDEPGLRAYLDRYPDGTFAQQATARLSEIEAAKQAAAAAEDNAAWEQAVAANTVQAYQTYLQAFPNGALVSEAQARIAALTAPDQVDDSAARAVEGQLGLNAITLRLVEARLQQLGLQPGRVDGSFDEETRRAVRNFQRDRSLTVSGFLNEETVVRLLADGLQSLGGN